jgi:hypothetical protein
MTKCVKTFLTFYWIMKKYSYILLFPLILFGCGIAGGNKPEAFNSNKIDTVVVLQPDSHTTQIELRDTTDYNHATYFIVVADTSQDYYLLHKKMINLNRQLNIPIDTMGRLYNNNKKLIALPENDEDEMYAGDYFPRRFPGDDLSLEYLNFYQNNAAKKTIALVAGIYENENTADSILIMLKQAEKKSFKIKANIYIGCMH